MIKRMAPLPWLMLGAGATFLDRAGLLQIDMAEMRKRVRHELGVILPGREQDEIDETFGNHGGEPRDVAVAAIDALLHDLIDVAVQAIGQLGLPLDRSSSGVCAFVPVEDARSMKRVLIIPRRDRATYMGSSNETRNISQACGAREWRRTACNSGSLVIAHAGRRVRRRDQGDR